MICSVLVADADSRPVIARDTLLRHAVTRPAVADCLVVPSVRLWDLEILFRYNHRVVRYLRFLGAEIILLHKGSERPDQIVEKVEVVVIHVRREQ